MGEILDLAKLATVVLAAFALVGAALPVGATPGAKPYIVVLRDGAGEPGGVAGEHGERHGARVSFVYGRALRGYAAAIPSHRVSAVLADPRVAYVERDRPVGIAAQTIPWGITRIGATLSSTRSGNGSGAISGVKVYVIDTGVAKHKDLNRLRKHVNFTGDGKNNDCNGHGTHVAGTIAAKDNGREVVGVAPGAPITGVKVLGCDGSGFVSGVIAGIDWVTANAKKPAIANLSLGSGPSTALDDAVRRSADGGVFYSVAAGNGSADACNSSPARAGAGTDNGIMTVAATNSDDEEASFSNFGPCVDIWAPGVDVLSTRKGGGVAWMSGTSASAPHVGGGGALYLSKNTSASPATVESALKLAASTLVTLSKDTSGTPLRREYVAAF